MKKVVIWVCLLIMLVSLTLALPPPPPAPASPGSASSAPPASTISTNVTTSATLTTTAENLTIEQQIQALSNQLNQANQKITSLENQLKLKTEIPQSSSPLGYFIFLLILNLLVIGAVVYLFLKSRAPKTPKIPESIKSYVEINLQRGYQEEQIRQQLSSQGWSAQQINQIFEEAHGF